jgi:hypothetical protein
MSYDEYLSTLVNLPVGYRTSKGKYSVEKGTTIGDLLGFKIVILMMDTREYEVIFPDGSVQSYLANTIAENLYSQVDDEGQGFSIMSEIIDHEKDESALT